MDERVSFRWASFSSRVNEEVSILSFLRSFLTGRNDSLQFASSILSYSESEPSELEYSGVALRFVALLAVLLEPDEGFVEGLEEGAFGTFGTFGTLCAEVEPSRSVGALARGTGRCCFEPEG